MIQYGIPTPQQFKSTTSPAGSRFRVKRLVTGRGSDLSLIDTALAAWEAAQRSQNQADKVKALRHISSACTQYLKNRIGKKTPLANQRKAEVRRLQATAVQILGKVSAAEGAFAANKHKAQLHGKHQNTTSLAKGYQHERTSYLKSGKQYAMAASAVHDDMDNFSGSSYKQYVNAFNREYAQQVENFDEDSARKALGVAYLSKSDRMEYMAIPHDGVFNRADGTPLNSTERSFGRRLAEVWAMDRYGNLFVKNPRSVGGMNYFNHSSFNAGNDVICAGNILFNAGGVLVYIDNGSGHYKPDAEALRSVLAYFDELGIDMREMRVGLMNPQSGQPVDYQALTVLGWPGIDPTRVAGDWLDQFNQALDLPNGPISA